MQVLRQMANDNVIKQRKAGVIEPEYFNFYFYRMGKWHRVTVDGNLPKTRRAQAVAEEWWVALAEKAYAAFNNSYSNIEGGYPAWALTELTSGVSIRVRINRQFAEIPQRDLGAYFAFIQEYLHKNTIFCTGNHGQGEKTEASGLIAGHAYSLLDLIDVKLINGNTVKLVQIRNPWGKSEWKGEWGDKSDAWKQVDQAEKDRIDFVVKNDGGFFMSVKDWLDQFESFTMCYTNLDDGETARQRLKDTRVIGQLLPEQNATARLKKCTKYNLQFSMVLEQDQDVWVQTLQDTKSVKERGTYVALRHRE